MIGHIREEFFSSLKDSRIVFLFICQSGLIVIAPFDKDGFVWGFTGSRRLATAFATILKSADFVSYVILYELE